ncbi:MAG: sigma-70 family RNA polymerase sigma factor [Paludisphaera borealis]|uniref:sigma-70 family RNA polymerase sigma factor n=1 Tax=Paludisphaera borealis TaxID=1387353 RepID=UPI002842A693|nr:sigma-70 family RNA polymerase sigma factor [Paludisphaera borealis]MDR3618972.1 sigma-70 family RNA polymerase sigma factor [Paludisphaera borealis]
MNDAMRRSPFSQRHEKTGFSDRTNPCRPPQPRDAERSPGQCSDASYPAKCDPRKPRTPLNDDQRGLTERYLQLAQTLAQRIARSWPAGSDEFQSAAFLALVEAAQAFDPSRNVDFATYARHRIRGALLDVQRELFSRGWRGQAERAPRFLPLRAGLETQGRVVGAQSVVPVGAELEAADAVENWLKKLSPRHATAFRHLYLDGKTVEEAAALAGCSKGAMSRLHRETLSWFHQAGKRSTTMMKPERKPYARPEPTAAVPANRRDRIPVSWSSRSNSTAQPRAFLGVAG